MNSTRIKIGFAFGILLYGCVVPLLPRAYIIFLTPGNTTIERYGIYGYADIFTLLHTPSIYFAIVFPFILLSGVSWLSLTNKSLSNEALTKRVLGVLVSFVVICPWGFSVSMPNVWGLAAGWFSIMSIIVVPIGYIVGYLIGHWIVEQKRR